MFYKKKGYPEENEIVLCTVKRILYHSVFVALDEYENQEGMIHISEISPGRIRNLRDFVKEEKRIVCKVLSVNREKNQIDLSLRRVGTSTMIQKLTDLKHEEKAEKFLEIIGKGLKINLKGMYEKVGFQAVKEYGSLYKFLQEAVLDKELIIKLCNEPKLVDAIYDFIKDKIKPQEVIVGGTFKIILNNENGIEIIRSALIKYTKESGVTITYLGAPKYKVEVTSNDYKTAETTLKKIVIGVTKDIEKSKGSIIFEKKKNE